VMIPARAPLTKQAQRTRVSPGPQVPLRGLAHEVGALGTQPGRSTESLAGARTVDYSPARDSMQSGDAPSSMSERFVTDDNLRPSGRNERPMGPGVPVREPPQFVPRQAVFGETWTARFHVCPAPR
jgi:hypothetical protein